MVPIEITVEGALVGEAVVHKTYDSPIPKDVSPVLAYLDLSNRRWVPVATTVAADRLSISAKTTHFSIWEDIAATIGALTSVRVGQPSCAGRSPAWVEDIVVVDTANSPLRWCAGSAGRNSDVLVVKIAANRSYGFGVRSAAQPVAFETSASSDPGWTSGILNWASAAGDSLITGDAAGLPLPPGEEISLSFRKQDVKALGPTEPLVSAVRDTRFVLAGLVYAAVVGEIGQSKNAFAKAVVASLAAQQCLATLGRSSDIAELSPELLQCLTDDAEAVVGAIVAQAPRGAANVAPNLVWSAMQKLGVVLAANVLGRGGVTLGEFIGDSTYPPQAFAAYLTQPIPKPPGWIPPDSTLDTTGLGPIKIGMTTQEARQLGLLVPGNEDCLGPWYEAPWLRTRKVGIEFVGEDITSVYLSGPHFRTRSGARVGMTLAEIQRIYGDRVQPKVKQGNGGPFEVWTVEVGDSEIVLNFGFEPPTSGTRVVVIMARKTSPDYFAGC